ncbi:UPF0496 protein [Acorus gramineus]|uniref:UPF0496 protein n=1 Tax=Acorus gramineus TaxID=55184 RepID=A0AAV9AGF5_ACOGR|nr:UPF0496 protein [Acorus gramineus]
MRCFSLKSSTSIHSPTSPPPNNNNNNNNNSSSSATATPRTVNLTREYTLAVQTNSYTELWSTIHHHEQQQQQQEDQTLMIDKVLHPNRDSIEEALRAVPRGNLTHHLVSTYFHGSERTSRLCLLLHDSVAAARLLYSPLSDLLDLLPSSSADVSQAQCDWAFDVLTGFDGADNPFQGSVDGFADTRHCFAELNRRLDRRRLRCLLFRRREELEAAAKGTYVLHNELDTIDRLVARLRATVEGDKVLVKTGLRWGRDRCSVREVVRHLRRTHMGVQEQMRDLEEHVCLCFATVNRARSQLLLELLRLYPNRHSKG